jgi:hypothetical protein
MRRYRLTRGLPSREEAPPTWLELKLNGVEGTASTRMVWMEHTARVGIQCCTGTSAVVVCGGTGRQCTACTVAGSKVMLLQCGCVEKSPIHQHCSQAWVVQNYVTCPMRSTSVSTKSQLTAMWRVEVLMMVQERSVQGSLTSDPTKNSNCWAGSFVPQVSIGTFRPWGADSSLSSAHVPPLATSTAFALLDSGTVFVLCPGLAMADLARLHADGAVPLWWVEQWWVGKCLSQALGAVNGMVGGLAGKVPQALGGWQAPLHRQLCSRNFQSSWTTSWW